MRCHCFDEINSILFYLHTESQTRDSIKLPDTIDKKEIHSVDFPLRSTNVKMWFLIEHNKKVCINFN